MGATAEELKYDIDRQRADLERDFDMIGDKVSPRRMVERRTDAAKSRIRRMRDAVMGTVEGVQGSVQDGGSSVRDKAGDLASGAGHMVTSAPDRIEHGTQGNPLVAGAVAFGFGLLVATVLPPSRSERRMAHRVQPQLEHAMQSAMESGREVVDEVRPAVEQAGNELGAAAKDAVAEVKDTAQEHASSAAETAKDDAAELRDRTSG